MIDLHCHILPNLDDGARDWDQAMRMCAMAVQEGIDSVVVTPHVRAGDYPTSVSDILSRLQELEEWLDREGLPLQILPGSEVFIDIDIPSRLEAASLLTLNRSRYLLLELPHDGVPPNTDRFVAILVAKGIIPIIAHPERNQGIQRNPSLLAQMVRAGALGQLTAASLTGLFGTTAKTCGQTLLKERLVHVLATDAHSDTKRTPVLTQGLAEASRIIGDEAARHMVQDIPARIVKNLPIVAEQTMADSNLATRPL